MNKELYNTITQVFERYFSNLKNEIIFHEEESDAWNSILKKWID